jgi:DNA transposition AAA+ family ATPase
MNAPLTPIEIKTIRHFLIDADMTLKALADACKLKYATVAYILRGAYSGPAARRVMEFVGRES